MKEIKAIMKQFNEKAILEYHGVIDSTNIRAKALAKEGATCGSLIIADKQTQGKGRLGKVWNSPKDASISMSMLLRPQIEPDKVSAITLVAGISISEAISHTTGLEAKIKWPNDIVINAKKVCGILTEMHTSQGQVGYVVVGVGVNVNIDHFDEQLPYATSLKLEAQRIFDREMIIQEYLKVFFKYYKVYIQEGFEKLREKYKANCINLNRQVIISSGKEKFEGLVKDIDKEGSLIILDGKGEERTVFTGEVSVRGLYGYV